MSARMFLEVKDLARKLQLTGRFKQQLPALKNKIVYESYAVNEKVVPRKGGGLQESFFFEIPNDETMVFGWNASYAKYVDEGVDPSPGRYVPAIGKRLTLKGAGIATTHSTFFEERGTELHPRRSIKEEVHTHEYGPHIISPQRQIYKEALARGYPERIARVALRTRIEGGPEQHTLMGKVEGEFHHAYRPEIKKMWADYKGLDKLRHPADYLTTEEIRSRAPVPQPISYYEYKKRRAVLDTKWKNRAKELRLPGYIVMPGDQDIDDFRRNLRHELGHAMDWITKREFGAGATTEDVTEYWKSPEETSARMWAFTASQHRGDIGMHPGFKGREYKKKFLVEMRRVAVNITVDALREVVSG